MSRLYLVRHAKAGSRSKWTGPDRARPLTEKGWRQAEAIANLLGTETLERVVSSPYLRCTQTVEPLTRLLGLDLDEDPDFGEGTAPDVAWLACERAAESNSVVCTHGDVLGFLLSALEARGVDLGRRPPLDKGVVWLVEHDGALDETAKASVVATP